MTDSTPNPDPLEFLKNLWSSMGMAVPGMVTPTLDAEELDKRITDLKTVEGWLRMNLNMLQMSIQGLEVQRATLAAMQAMSQTASSADPAANPFANPALWPWNLMNPAPADDADADAAPDAAPAKGKAKGKPE